MTQQRSVPTAIVLVVMSLFLTSCPVVEAANDFSGKPRPPVVIEKPLPAPQEGEHLVYDVFWMGIFIGTSELEVKPKSWFGGEPAHHVAALARTNDFLSHLYPVHDEVESFIDARDFHSVQFRKILREGRYRADEETTFDAASKTGHYHSLLNGTRKDFSTGGAVQDILSAFYWFRTQEVQPGRSIHVPVSSEEKDYDVEIRVLRTEKKGFHGQTIDTLVIEPKTSLKGILYDRGRVLVYFTTDAKRVPLWIAFQTPFGPVVGVLKSDSYHPERVR
jgi:hypothetical protein